MNEDNLLNNWVHFGMRRVGIAMEFEHGFIITRSRQYKSNEPIFEAEELKEMD